MQGLIIRIRKYYKGDKTSQNFNAIAISHDLSSNIHMNKKKIKHKILYLEENHRMIITMLEAVIH